MKLAQWYTERRLLFTDLLQAIQRKIEALAHADSRSPYEAEGVSFQPVSLPELLL
jgi:hypothetical protein